MNLYLIVEGRRTEPRLFRAWLPVLVDGLSEARRVEDIDGHSFFLVPGRGYPSLLRRVENAAADCSHWPFHHLIVCADAEQDPASVRAATIQEVIEGARIHIPSSVIVADCCVESWLLGNRRIVRRNPQREAMRAWLSFYDVVQLDPEKMPGHPRYRTRAVTHKEYLKEVFRERNLSYTERHPGEAASRSYLNELEIRARETPIGGPPHLQSFSRLLALVDSLNEGP